MKAESPAKRVLALIDNATGPVNPYLIQHLNNLARVRIEQGNYAGAERLVERALFAAERDWGKASPELAPILKNYALLLRKNQSHRQGKGSGISG